MIVRFFSSGGLLSALLMLLTSFAAAVAPAQGAQSDAPPLLELALGGDGDGGGPEGFPTWHSLAEPTFIRSRPGGNWVADKFYLIGGEYDPAWGWGSRSDKVEIYSTNNTWTIAGALMPFPVSNIMGSTAVLGDEIYVFGGFDWAGNGLNIVQVYDTIADTWRISSHLMPEPLFGCLAVTVGDEIYVMGGWTDTVGNSTNDVWTFDPGRGGGFTQGPGMPTPRYLITGALASNGKIYVVAGAGTETSFESLDTSTGTWAVEPAIPTNRFGCGVVAVGNYVVLYGGPGLASCELFDIQAGVWETWKSNALGVMAERARTFAYGLYTGPGGPAAFGTCGWGGPFNYYIGTTNALYE